MRILIFDDDRDYVTNKFERRFLQLYPEATIDVRITNRPTVEGCIEEVDYRYDLIFIDFKFYGGKDAINGADIGLGIRQSYALIPLVLMTNFGAENLDNFIHVGFDSYYNKHVEGDRKQLVSSLKKSIETAMLNNNRRVPRDFSDDKLSTVKSKLDSIEAVYSEKAYGKNVQTQVSEDAVVYYQNILGKRGGSRQIIEALFKINDPRSPSNIRQECLQTLCLLKRHPESWLLAREKYPPLKKLISQFGLGN